MGAASFCRASAEQKIERTAGMGFPGMPEPFASKKTKRTFSTRKKVNKTGLFVNNLNV